MLFLANENLPLDAVEALRQVGHDVAWVHAEAPGSTDRAVLARAAREGRVLLTFDKDFGELAFRAGLPASCGIVLFRLRASSAAALAAEVVEVIQTQTDWAGHFAVAEFGRVRMRPLPQSAGPEEAPE